MCFALKTISEISQKSHEKSERFVLTHYKMRGARNN